MIGAIIVTFNPIIDTLSKNIESVVGQVNKVLIVDNGSKNVENIEKLSLKYDIHILKIQENIGIAAALNIGMEYFDRYKYKWAVTLDQDSILERDTVDKLTRTSYFFDSKTAIVAARYIDKEQSRNHTNLPFEENLYAITSGGIVRISAWKEVEGFDEQLFIDNVDNDFNQRLHGLGYNIIQANRITFQHSLGDPVPNRPFLKKILMIKKELSPTDHSAFRQFYISKNGIIMAKRYYKPVLLQIFRVIANTRQILLFRSPIKKILASYRGIIAGLRYSTEQDEYFQNYLKKTRIKIDERKD